MAKIDQSDSFNDSTVVICAPNNFAQEWLESRYTKLIEGTIYDYTGKHVSVKFIIETEEQKLNPPRHNRLSYRRKVPRL